ncbi:MAG: DUF5703 domain-containing protein, partial [Candidatus Sumerlaeota bacterium]|nr:DUF5703 domain-containing protein [Candidatus Sumerlaeota bacterium]
LLPAMMNLAFTVMGGSVAGAAEAADDLAWLGQYNVVWTTQSKNSSESMPCGGGDIGMNVWIEQGDLLFYMQRSGCFDENNAYLKLGRVRVRLDPNPFIEGAEFRQELKLREGCVEILGRKDNLWATVQVWVEALRPVVRVDVAASQPVRVNAAYESWRTADESLPNDKGRARFGCFSWDMYPGEVTRYRDEIRHEGAAVLFYHRNRDGKLLFDYIVRQQGLEKVKDRLVNTQKGRTFGGLMRGEGFVSDGTSESQYLLTPFKAWRLRSTAAAQRHHLQVFTHLAQTDSLKQWQDALTSLSAAAKPTAESALEMTRSWWAEFWRRSHIVINPRSQISNPKSQISNPKSQISNLKSQISNPKSEVSNLKSEISNLKSQISNPESDKPWQIARNYQLFRYQLGCNARGEYPTKFNGGNFTFDPSLVSKERAYNPDWRAWGGGSFTAQNQRLVYWPMLKSGDADMMLPQLEFYRRALPNAVARVQTYWGHDGCLFTEQIENFGLPFAGGWGWSEPEATGRQRGQEIPFGDPRADAVQGYNSVVEHGVQANGAVSYHWESQLEFSYMMLEHHRFFGADIKPWLPMIQQSVRFFDEHYQRRERLRSGQPLDAKGKLVIYPSTSCESYRGARNPADLIAGLSACLEGLLALDDSIVPAADKTYYKGFLSRVPEYTYTEVGGDRILQPAESWKRYQNVECPQFYPLFPFNRFMLGRDDMTVFRNTWKHGKFPKNMVISWHQDGIFFARMGQAQEAADYNTRKLENSPRRFPTFWGPGHDWVPDHNWGGSGMIGLQEMLLQTDGDHILLLPAWPKDWDVDFKLHAPRNTIVEVIYRAGKVESLKVTPESRRKDIAVF